MRLAGHRYRLAPLALLALGSCSDAPSTIDVAAYGGRIRVSCAQPLPAQARAELRALIVDYDRRLHPWRADGELQALNRALAAGRPFAPSPILKRTLEAAMHGHRLTLGAFDPAYASSADGRARRPRLADLTLNPDGLYTGPSTLRLDLNAIAEGALARATADLLGSRFDCLIDSGGDLYAFGPDSDRRWRVAIEDPQSFQPASALTLKTGDALYVSGRYRQPGHLHGALATSDQPLQAVVLDRDPEQADALATALMVAEPATRAQMLAAARSSAVQLHLTAGTCVRYGDWTRVAIKQLRPSSTGCTSVP